MNNNSVAFADITDNIISKYRMATISQFDLRFIQTIDDNSIVIASTMFDAFLLSFTIVF